MFVATVESLSPKSHINERNSFARINAEWHGGVSIPPTLTERLSTKSNAKVAVQCLTVMGTSAGNTVLGHATTALVRKETVMDSDLNKRVAAYRATMSLTSEMLEKGIISAEEYAIIDTIMAKKYGLSSCTIFSE